MKFSIITCTYNAEDVLETTLKSVARQSYAKVEHIIIDGRSTDSTMSIIRRYEQKESQHEIIVVSEKDSGLYDAMNKGISMATGKYLVFLNAGDTLHSTDTISSLAEKAKDREYGVIYGDTNITDRFGNYVSPRRLRPPSQLTWQSFQDGMLVCHQAFYANTRLARHTPYDLSYRISSDVDWCIRIMKKAEEEKLPLLNSQLTLCNYLKGGMSVKNHRKSLIERFNIMKKHYGLLTTIYKHFTFLFRK